MYTLKNFYDFQNWQKNVSIMFYNISNYKNSESLFSTMYTEIKYKQYKTFFWTK